MVREQSTHLVELPIHGESGEVSVIHPGSFLGGSPRRCSSLRQMRQSDNLLLVTLQWEVSWCQRCCTFSYKAHGFEIFKYERNRLRFLMIFNMALVSYEDITLHT
ncbi:unnamed protein product [Musa acuminata subsp. burmannicoides]